MCVRARVCKAFHLKDFTGELFLNILCLDQRLIYILDDNVKIKKKPLVMDHVPFKRGMLRKHFQHF